jgi:hypothetical protein
MKSGEFISTAYGEGMPEFVVPHDGTQPEVPDKEQSLVAEKFFNLVDDTLLTHVEDVTSTSSGESRVVLGSFRKEPGVVYKLKITRPEDFIPIDGIEHADQSLAVIELTRDINGRDKEQLSYKLGADGVVRRHTVEDLREKRKLEREIYELEEEQRNADSEDAISMVEVFRRTRIEATANRELERDMGVNRQPVGFEEMTGLADFISDMGFESPQVYNRRVLAEWAQ